MLEVEKKQFEQERRTAQATREASGENIRKTKENHIKAEKDSKNAITVLEYFKGKEVSSIIADSAGNEFIGSREVGTKLKETGYALITKNPSHELQDTGCKAGNFQILLKRTGSSQYYRLVLKGEMVYGTTGERGDIKSEPAQVGLYIRDCIEQAERFVNGLSRNIMQHEEIIAKSDEILNRTFTKKDLLEEKIGKLYELLKDIETRPPKNFLDPIKRKIEERVNAGLEYRLGHLDQIPDIVEVYEPKKTPLINGKSVSQILRKVMVENEQFENKKIELTH
jgi:hypothetical protein